MPVAQRTQHVRVVGAHRVWPVIVPDGVKNTLSSCHVWVRWMRRQNERAPRGGICTEEMTVHRKGQVERERADALVGQSEGGTESTDRLCTGETAGVRVLFRYSLTQTVFNKSREQFDPLTGLWWPPPFRLPRLCLFHCHHTVGEGNRSPTAVRDSKRHEWTRGRVRGRTGTSPRCRHPTWTRGKQSLGGRSSAGHQLANERRKESAEQCRGWGRVRPSSLGSAHQAQQGRFRGGGQGRPRRRTAHSRPPASSWPGIQIYCRGGVCVGTEQQIHHSRNGDVDTRPQTGGGNRRSWRRRHVPDTLRGRERQRNRFANDQILSSRETNGAGGCERQGAGPEGEPAGGEMPNSGVTSRGRRSGFRPVLQRRR
eukprot:GGOE01010667.1.p1 GENE.GGOE01010667.1~~GGOE01010667.1.p1  ORF type:complete len:369 (+),score=-48.04 GGOE01010667.1:451-1557(+)